MLVLDEAVVDRGHQEVSDASTSITETSCESIACADDVLVEEASHPHLTWYEATAEDADKEAQGIKLCGGECGTREKCWDGSDEQAPGECSSGAETIACWAGHETDEEGCGQSNDVGISDLDLGELKIFLDGDIYLYVSVSIQIDFLESYFYIPMAGRHTMTRKRS